MNDITTLPILDPLDKRLNAYRPDLVDVALFGQIKSSSIVAGKTARISMPVADVKVDTDDGNTQHQFVFGENISVSEDKDGWKLSRPLVWMICFLFV